MDNSDLTTICVVGDGEAETGTLSASWHLNKFMIPGKDGVVLPILHLNGYSITGPTVYGTMDKDELEHYFKGLGYQPYYLDQEKSGNIYKDFLKILYKAVDEIEKVKKNWTEYKVKKPNFPIIILRTKKGWSCPKEVNGRLLEGTNYSHFIPLEHPKEDANEFKALKQWLESYKVHELINSTDNSNGFLNKDIQRIIPEDQFKLGRSEHINSERIELELPPLEDHEFQIFKRGGRPDSEIEEISQYIRDVFDLDEEVNAFRLFSPDESESNLLNPIFDATSRTYVWPLKKQDDYFSYAGKILELLSENVLIQAMMGYILSGRNGLIVSYEAFTNIVSSQIDQFMKYLKQRSEIEWRKPISSLNIIATSTLWRQEHNGYTHQNPSLINSLLAKVTDFSRLYFPIDVNSGLVTMEKVLKSENLVNLITMDKREKPQWLSLEEAKRLLKYGYLEFEWASNYENQNYDVVLATCGDYQNIENLAAVDMLNDLIPELRIKVLYFNEISHKGLGSFDYPIDNQEEVENIFSKDKDVIFNFHGYPSAIEQLMFKFNVGDRFKVLGYRENGTTTTPFDMQVLNGTSRFHVAIEALNSAAKFNKKVATEKELLVEYFEKKLQKHKQYIKSFGKDMPEVVDWKWAD